MAITSIDDIASGLSVAQWINYCKNITVPKAIGSWQSSWLGAGVPGAGAASPAYNAGAGYTCDDSTAGGIALVNAATQLYLAKLLNASVIAGTFIIADRLWSCSGMGYGASTYTVTTPGNLPARITDNGVGCELWVEQFAAAGAATVSLTCAYKNPANGDETGVINPVVSAPVIGQMQQVPLQVGSTGIRSLVSCTNSNTWTSGSWGMTILKRIATIDNLIAGVGKTLDWASLGLPKMPNDACLMFMFQGAAATATQIIGQMALIDK